MTASTGKLVVQAATAINADYLPFAAALVTTLAAHRARCTQVKLTILHAGNIDEWSREQLVAIGPGLSLEWLQVSAGHYADLGLDMTGIIAQPHYFRCLLAHLLKPDVRRVIYLDADTMVIDDLAALYDIDLAGAPVAAVRDWLPTVRDAVGPWQRLGLQGDAPYFNSGVLLIDLPRWREEAAGPQALRRCLEDRAYPAAQGRWQQHEQYGLTVVFHQRWHALSWRWNRFSELPTEDACIVHMVGGKRQTLATRVPTGGVGSVLRRGRP